MISFNATCPNRHMGLQTYYKDRLRELLDLGNLWLWCARCDSQWQPANDELDAIRRLLQLQD